MRVIVHAGDMEAERLVVDAVRNAEADVEALPIVAEFRTALFRDANAIGIIWTTSPKFAEMTLREYRLDAVFSPIIVLLEHPDNYIPLKRVAHIARLLGNGADDVQPFPIDERELVERLRALSRRQRPPASDIVELPNNAYYRPDQGEIWFSGGLIHLTGKERDVFTALTARPHVTFTKSMLIEILYQGMDEPELKIIDVFICKLRKKLDAALDGIDVIETVWGRGHRYRPEGFIPEVTDLRTRRAG